MIGGNLILTLTLTLIELAATQQVYLSTRVNLTNNTELLITSIGEDGSLPRLTCHTDLEQCCTRMLTTDGEQAGEWRYPNGTVIQNFAGSQEVGENFYIVRNAPRVIRLARIRSLSPTGMYCCTVPTTGGVMTLCANLVVCLSLPPLANGTVLYSDPTLGLDTVATHSCDPGFALSPGISRTRICGMNGIWSGSAPSCQALSDTTQPLSTDTPTDAPTDASTDAPTDAPTDALPTDALTTDLPATDTLTTNALITDAPTTDAPTNALSTDLPTTNAPTDVLPTDAPTSNAPTTDAPTTNAPTDALSTNLPTTNAPTDALPTDAPTSNAPTTDASTDALTTDLPTTDASTTHAPDAPTSNAPTTDAPTTVALSTDASSQAPTTDASLMENTAAEPVLFQLRLLNIPNCPEWVMGMNVDGRKRIEKVKDSFLTELESYCQCGFSPTDIIEPRFRCFSESNTAVTFRAKLVDPSLLVTIENWIQQKGLITVEKIQFEVDQSCQVSVSSLTESECKMDLEVPLIAGVVTGACVVVFVIVVVIAIVIWRKRAHGGKLGMEKMRRFNSLSENTQTVSLRRVVTSEDLQNSLEMSMEYDYVTSLHLDHRPSSPTPISFLNTGFMKIPPSHNRTDLGDTGDDMSYDITACPAYSITSQTQTDDRCVEELSDNTYEN